MRLPRSLSRDRESQSPFVAGTRKRSTRNIVKTLFRTVRSDLAPLNRRDFSGILNEELVPVYPFKDRGAFKDIPPSKDAAEVELVGKMFYLALALQAEVASRPERFGPDLPGSEDLREPARGLVLTLDHTYKSAQEQVPAMDTSGIEDGLLSIVNSFFHLLEREEQASDWRGAQPQHRIDLDLFAEAQHHRNMSLCKMIRTKFLPKAQNQARAIEFRPRMDAIAQALQDDRRDRSWGGWHGRSDWGNALQKLVLFGAMIDFLDNYIDKEHGELYYRQKDAPSQVRPERETTGAEWTAGEYSEQPPRRRKRDLALWGVALPVWVLMAGLGGAGGGNPLFT